jgi:hypothetical protein
MAKIVKSLSPRVISTQKEVDSILDALINKGLYARASQVAHSMFLIQDSAEHLDEIEKFSRDKE